MHPFDAKILLNNRNRRLRVSLGNFRQEFQPFVLSQKQLRVWWSWKPGIVMSESNFDGNPQILRLILTIGRFRTFKLGFSKRSSIWGAGGSCKQNFVSKKRISRRNLKTYSLCYGCYPLTVNWRDRLSDFRKKAKHQQLRYLTSTSDWASIQQTLEGFRRDPRAISWETEHPSGKWGRRGIWLVHCEMASISGASFTIVLPLGDDLPGSCGGCKGFGLDRVWH